LEKVDLILSQTENDYLPAVKRKAELLMRAGREEEAAQLYYKSVNMIDSTYNESLSKQINQLRTIHEVDKLELQNKQIELESERYKLTISLALVAVLIIVLIVSVFHYLRIKHIKSKLEKSDKELKKDKELISFYRGWLKSNNYEDHNLNLLTQDFIYAVARHLNSETYKKIARNKERTGKITHIEANKLKKQEIIPQHTYTGVKGVDYIRIAKENSARGFSGEMWVQNYERDRLSAIGLDPDSVRHASILDGDGIGYDILSLEDDGITPRYIEVKTTSGSESQSIYFTDNEMRFSTNHRDHYYLYRVYNFKAANKTADLTIIKGSLDEIPAETVVYKASIKY
jgi:hypothetical protein